MRWLGVDFGFARIGIAVAESEFDIVTPRPAISASGALKRDAQKLQEIARKEEVEGIVVGLPLESGEEGKMARICRMLAQHLTDLGESVKLVDESLTSLEADRVLRDEGLKASERRKHRDGEAACRILERYLHEETNL